MRKLIEKGLYRYFDREGRPGAIIVQFRHKGHRVYETISSGVVEEARVTISTKIKEINTEIELLCEQEIELEQFGDDIKLSEAVQHMGANVWNDETGHQRDSLVRMDVITEVLDDPRCLDIKDATLRKLVKILSSENIGTKKKPKFRRPTTINRFLVSLKTVLKAVHEEGMLPKMPKFKKVMVAEKQYRRDRLISKEEFNTIRKFLMRPMRYEHSTEARKKCAQVLTIAWYTGMRIGEILNIRFDRHINLANRAIMITADMAKGKSIRTVPMHDRVYNILSRTVPDKEGRPFGAMTVNFVAKCFRQARNSMGITDPNFVPHAIRHTVATDLLNHGVDVMKVQTLLGHESVTTTMVYTHLSAESLRNDLINR